MNDGKILNSKFHSIGNKKTIGWSLDLLSDEVKRGIVGPTKSLVGDFSNEEKIIERIEAMRIIHLSVEDVIQFRTRKGFDYQNFLRYLITYEKLGDINIRWLENFVYYQELMSKKKKTLDKFYQELQEIEELVDAKGVRALKDTSYGLISFLCIYAARDITFRKKYKDILLKISEKMEIIDKKIIESKEKESVKYKGVTIRLFGDNIATLKNGLQMVMQAINNMPPAFRKQLAVSNTIRITDCPSPSNFNTLMCLDKHLNDKDTEQFIAIGCFTHSDRSITFHDIGRKYSSVKGVTTTLAHELGHSLDYTLLFYEGFISDITKIWEKAKKADGNKVSDYGDKYIKEDFAEFCLEYVKSWQLNGTAMTRLREKYPNRMRVLEALLDIRMYNKNKPNRIPLERKIEIMREFESEWHKIADIFLTKKRKLEVFSMPPDKKLEYAQEMCDKGIPCHFLEAFSKVSFVNGMNADQLKQLYHMFESVKSDARENLLEVIMRYAEEKHMIDKKNIFDRMLNATPVNQRDESELEYLRTIPEVYSDVNHFDIYWHIHCATTGDKPISEELLSEYISIILDEIGKKDKPLEREL